MATCSMLQKAISCRLPGHWVAGVNDRYGV